MAINEILADHGVTQAELAAGIGMAEAALSRRLNGHRSWRVEEANAALSFLRERCKMPRLKLDDLFGVAA